MTLKKDEVHFLGQVNQKALIFKEGKILLLQYPKEDLKVAGMWDMPGGRLNVGEVAVEGLKREVFEETGQRIEIQKILTTGTFVNLSGKPNFFIIHQAVLVGGEQPLILEKSEVGAFAWVDPKEFFNLPIIYPEYQKALLGIL
ncbi:NUDIX domain-containing protein [Patescibacteria group bacterium]|nr:MAG: NUDIX domain-containing protein [Patescibacteria group bacterium]